MGKVVHPCRVKSFQKAVSTVTDDLGTDVKTIENFNLIVKLCNKSAWECFLGDRGGDSSV